jgi:hypothetical protein
MHTPNSGLVETGAPALLQFKSSPSNPVINIGTVQNTNRDEFAKPAIIYLLVFYQIPSDQDSGASSMEMDRPPSSKIIYCLS